MTATWIVEKTAHARFPYRIRIEREGRVLLVGVERPTPVACPLGERVEHGGGIGAHGGEEVDEGCHVQTSVPRTRLPREAPLRRWV